MSVVVPEEAEKKAIYPPQILHAWIGGHTPNSFSHQLKSKVLVIKRCGFSPHYEDAR